MGYFVKINDNLTKHYEAQDTKDAFKNFLSFAYGLKFHKINYVSDGYCKEIYFDTQNHLLNSSGIILSRFQEANNVFFKVENTTELAKKINIKDKKIYVHKVGTTDKISDHAFYIREGIESLYSTPFSIDLENVINSATAKMEVTIKAQIYELISGTGMKAKIALENKTVKNFETKRKYNVLSLTLKLDSNPTLYLDDFTQLNNNIQKNCKQFLEINEHQFDFATNVTKPIIKEIPKKKEKKNI